MNRPKTKELCCTHELRERASRVLNTGFRLALVGANYIEDTAADVSADVAAGWPVGGAVALSMFANLSGFIYDVRALKVKLPDCENETWYSYLLHFLAAVAVFLAYAYSTYNGSKEDFEPEQFVNSSHTEALIDSLGLSDQALSWLALLPAMGWVVSEGTAGFALFAGKVLIDKLLRMAAKNCCNPVRCRSRKAIGSGLLNGEASLIQARLGRMQAAWPKASFVLLAVGFAGIALQAWSSLFDVFVVTAASMCAQSAVALTGLRVVTGFLALCLSAYFYDYYLRDAKKEWVLPCMSHPAMRSFSALGVAAFFFAMSFNRARHFLQDEFSLSIELGESGFTYSAGYAAGMTSLNLMRYILFCWDESKSASRSDSLQSEGPGFAASINSASGSRSASVFSNYGATGHRSTAGSTDSAKVIPTDSRSASVSVRTERSINN
jgi:hypothetical protein